MDASKAVEGLLELKNILQSSVYTIGFVIARYWKIMEHVESLCYQVES